MMGDAKNGIVQLFFLGRGHRLAWSKYESIRLFSRALLGWVSYWHVDRVEVDVGTRAISGHQQSIIGPFRAWVPRTPWRTAQLGLDPSWGSMYLLVTSCAMTAEVRTFFGSVDRGAHRSLWFHFLFLPNFGSGSPPRPGGQSGFQGAVN